MRAAKPPREGLLRASRTGGLTLELLDLWASSASGRAAAGVVLTTALHLFLAAWRLSLSIFAQGPISRATWSSQGATRASRRARPPQESLAKTTLPIFASSSAA